MKNIEKLARYIVRTGNADRIMAALRFAAAASEVEAKTGSECRQDTRVLGGDISGRIQKTKTIKNIS